MTFGELKEQVLKLINRHSTAGVLIPTSYNNQADYIERIPDLANDAIMEIATTTRKIQTTFHLNNAASEDLGNMIRYRLPEDFYQFKSGDTAVTTDGKLIHTNIYIMQGKRYVIIPKTELVSGNTYTAPSVELTYYRYPNLLPHNAQDNVSLDNVPETHFAVALYVAGQMIYESDQSSGTKLLNQYADRLANMVPDISAEIHPVDDVYGFTNYNFM